MAPKSRFTRALLLNLTFAAAAPAAVLQGSRAPEVHCILHAKIVTGGGAIIENGRIVIRDGRIEIVDSGAAAPADARVIDATGLTVYPGFVDSSVVGGIVPLPIVNEGTPRDPSAEASARMQESHRKGIRPDASGITLLDIKDDLAGPRRQAGFTFAFFEPPAATIGGRGTLADLSAGARRDVIIRADAAMAAELRPGAGEGYPVSIMGAVATFRQAMLDADWYRKSWKSYSEHSKQMARPTTDVFLASLEPVLDGAMPVAFEASTPTQILRSLAIADEFHINPWIVGGREAWKCAAALANKKVPVLLSLEFGTEPKEPPKNEQKRPPRAESRSAESAPASQPAANDYKWPNPDAMSTKMRAERKRLYEEGVRNAVELVKSGVSVAFTTRGLRSPNDIHGALAKLIEQGLTREQALDSLTKIPAQLFGVSEILGKVEAGRAAYLIVAKGSLGDKEFKVQNVFIHKKRFDYEDDGGGATPASAPAGGRRRPREGDGEKLNTQDESKEEAR